MPRQALHPADYPFFDYGRLTFSLCIVAAEGDPAAGGIVEQCREIYARIGKLLASGGSGLDAVVKTTEFVTPAVREAA
jgi:hypothetical protein